MAECNLKKALLISGERSFRNTEMIALLKRANFSIDFLTSNLFHFFYKDVKNFIYISHQQDKPFAIFKKTFNYDLVVSLGDFELKIIIDSNLPVASKLKLLPIIKAKNIKHLCSKIELSKIFKKNNIPSPAFEIVNEYKNIDTLAKKLGFPVLLKIDYSGGGAGTFKLNASHDILKIPNHFKGRRLLLQKFIDGKLLDLSGFYQQGKLIHFGYSEFIEANSNPFGPSILKRYVKNRTSDKNIIQELSAIGYALGLNGFTNVGCLESNLDGNRYYFEVDVRPNDWINYPSYFGDDPALSIKNYFDKNDFIKPLKITYKNQEKSFVLANPSRLNFYELIINKYHWMGYSSFYSVLMHRLSLLAFNPIEKFKVFSVRYIKPNISIKNWKKLKQLALKFSL